MKQPTCSWVQDHFAPYKKGKLEAAQADAVFAHLMSCGQCRALLWEPESRRFRDSLAGGAWLVDRAVAEQARRYGRIPQALAASEPGGRVGYARGITLLGDAHERRVDVYCQARLVGGTPGTVNVQLPPALKLSGVREPWRPMIEALHTFISADLPPLLVDVALDGPGPLPPSLVLTGDSLHLPVALACASVWLDLPLRRDRLYTGALRGDGLLLEVGDLDEKLYLMPSGHRLVVPARNDPGHHWRGRALLAADLGQALDHASATLPEGLILSISSPAITPAVAAVRATLERLSGPGIVLALPMDNPSGAPLWFIGGRAGLAAFVPEASRGGSAAIAAARATADRLRQQGILSRERPPFPLRGFDLTAAGGTALPELVPEVVWMSPERLAAELLMPVKGRAWLPWSTALSMARAMWSWSGLEGVRFDAALPAEPRLVMNEPGLTIGKARATLRPGGRHNAQAGARWCDPDVRLPFADLSRHLFLAGNGSAGNLTRTVAEGCARARIPTVVLDLAGGMASMCIPATEEALASVGKRLPGADARLRTWVESRKPWPGEADDAVDPVQVRLTWAGVPGPDAPGMPPREFMAGLRIIDAHHRSAEARLSLLGAWCSSLSRVPTQTVTPGRPRVVLVICPGSLLSVGGPAVEAVETLLRAGPQVGVGVILSVRTPADLHPSLVSLCQQGMIGSPGAAGVWPSLPAGWADWSVALANLGHDELVHRVGGAATVIQARLPASLPLPEPPLDLLHAFAAVVDGEPTSHSPKTTVLPDAEEQAPWFLEEVGVLLPKVPFQKQVAGYKIPLGAAGEVGGHPSKVFAQLIVVREAHGYDVTLEVLEGEGDVDGRPLPPGSRLLLEGDHHITVQGHTLHWRRTREGGLPYIGEIAGVATRHWPVGVQGARIGRDHSRCTIWLPDRQAQEDLLWVGGSRPRGAEGLYLDAIHASGLHGAIALDSRGANLSNLSTRSPLFHRRDKSTTTLSPGDPSITLQAGDELLIGQRVFRFGAG